ncbi:MAG: multicopper oxidase domain-containing protein [Phycisphaeraceae bacterium]|nr:multicopper oxidase domain-containing protein [Phycisphaeraceae bacterium]
MNRTNLLGLVLSLMLSLVVRADVVVVYVFNLEFSINQPPGPVVDAVINVGDTVRWVHVQGNHTTTAVAGTPEQWDAPITSSNPVFEHTFTHAGTWWYYCRPHGFDNGDQTAGGMAGTVTVLPAGSGACCMADASCMIATPEACTGMGGTFQGPGSACQPNPCQVQPITLVLEAAKDNTLYEDAAGALSNALGTHLYTGNQNSGQRRRAVIAFDVSTIPSGAAVQSVQLRMHCNQAQGSTVHATVHRLLADWGEGTSLAGGNEGSGGAATTGDATWLHRYHSTVFWSTPGGDFSGANSAMLMIPATTGFYTFTGAGLIADVQAWVNAAAPNAGWIIRGDEGSSSNTRRYSSRQSTTVANRPQLTVVYLPPQPAGACCQTSGVCVLASESACAAQGGTFHGSGVSCASVSCPVQLTPFVDELPRPAVAQPVTGVPGGSAHYEIAMVEVAQHLHRDLPPTRVWGYAGTYPGPTIEARRGMPVTVTWINDLRVLETGVHRTTHVLPVDECLHGPDVTGQTPVTVVHLHGGHVPADSDGYPEHTFGPGGQSPVYTYPNNQPAATIWYHDHALGITRLNVMMGLAGFYILRDDEESALGLPAGEFEVALAIQDRSFNPDGSLRYPEMWHDHFFGDVALVNGKVWPYMHVKRGKYRFRLLNGSNSRAYDLSLSNDATMLQIGTDLGLMAAPVASQSLVLVPGERAEVIIDFADFAPGTEIILNNSAPSPFPFGGAGPDIPQIMKFIVGAEAGHTDPVPGQLVAVPTIAESEAILQRDFDLRQVPNTHCAGHHDGLWTINGLMWDDITEFPRLGTTEIWAWRNVSGVVHPMHMHLVAVQVLDRQEFDTVTGQPIGPRVPADPSERGWKDTVQASPGHITRVIARFENYTGLFPYHCHILEHEDHEMMRQMRVLCAADFDLDGTVAVSDIFAFLTAWFANDPAAYAFGGTPGVPAIFAFLTAWFAGC